MAHRRQNYLSIVKSLTFSKLPQHYVSVVLDEADRKLSVRELPASDTESEEEESEASSQLFQVNPLSASSLSAWHAMSSK